MKSYRFALITPQSVVFEGEVVSLVAPGGAGSLGVLANHAPLVTTLSPGRLMVTVPTVTAPEGESKSFEIGAGFLDVFKNEVTVISESVKSAS